MEAKEIEEGNLLIALFMGAEIMSSSTSPKGVQTITSIAFKDNGGYFRESIRNYRVQLHYHESWEKLMPIILRIGEFKFDDYTHDDGTIDHAYMRTFGMKNQHGKYMVRINRHSLFEADTLIEAAWLAVIDFIKT